MAQDLTLSRRSLLRAMGTGVASLPLLSLPGFLTAAGATPGGDHTLVLIELAGGNDGLNTVIPHRDRAYRSLRPEIRISRRDTLSLDRNTGLHPSMRHIADLWERGEVQIIEGVGYPNPNRSHFRSIEIWNAGLGAMSKTTQGWLSQSFSARTPFDRTDAWGLALDGDLGPINGPGRFSAMRDINELEETIAQFQNPGHAVRPVQASPLDHVLDAYDRAETTAKRVLTKLERNATRLDDFPETELGTQLANAARLMEAGVTVPVLKVSQSGFDTHEGQPEQHADLLFELSEALGAFARALKQSGRWQTVTVVTYSEFGRTARENASGGTDHGTAAPVLVMGGAVRGGLSGQRPDLEALYEDDLVHTTDYRSIYQAILNDLWAIDAPQFKVDGAPKIRLL